MSRLRTVQMIGTLLTGAAIGLLVFGWVRLPIAMLCIVCLILFASVDALRGVTATPQQKAQAVSQPTPVLRYRATETRPYPIELHLDGCTCPDCLPPLPLARLTIAGALVGNLIAFAWDPLGALTALAATIGVTL